MIFEAPSGVTYQVGLVTSPDDVTGHLRAITDVMRDFRGGHGLLAEICDGHSEAEAVDRAIMNGELWGITDDSAIVGLLLLRRGILLGIHVSAPLRRQGIARGAITTLRSSGVVISDARALPGDRATKSLFESLGWKARMLTMSPAERP